MEDVWCGEWSSTALIGAVSLEKWENEINLELSNQKALAVKAEGTVWDNLSGEGSFTIVYNACSPPFSALKYLKLRDSNAVCTCTLLSSCLRGSVCVCVCVCVCQCECVFECQCECVSVRV